MDVSLDVSNIPFETLLAIGVSLSIVLITSLILVCVCLRRGQRGRVVCLLGLSNSGKTLLYMRITNGDFVRTQTSIKENKTNYHLNNKGSLVEIELVDIPGDERLRQRTFQQYIDSLMGVVILIDSVNFSKESRDLSHVVIDLLSEPRVNKKRVPVLIACNKQDLSLAAPVSTIQETLEDEITQILTSQSVKLSSIDQSKERKRISLLSSDNKTSFTFSSVVNSVQVVGCSARGKGEESNCEPEIEPIFKWMDSLVS